MPRIAVGLFSHPGPAKLAIEDLAASGFPRADLRLIGEPRVMDGVTFGSLEGVEKESSVASVSTARANFESQLSRELLSYGATEAEMRAYVQGVKRGGALVFAGGPDVRVDSAVEVLNRRGAMDVEELWTANPDRTSAPSPPTGVAKNMTPIRDESVQVGRSRSSGGGARVFVW